jgi:hypothetical protein
MPFDHMFEDRGFVFPRSLEFVDFLRSVAAAKS